MKKPKIPTNDSIKKLAEFWDKHDSTDFEDELEEVTEPMFKPAADSFRQGWKEAQEGKMLPIERLWDGIDAE